MRLSIHLWVNVATAVTDEEAEDIAEDISAILVREIPAFLDVDVVDWNEA